MKKDAPDFRAYPPENAVLYDYLADLPEHLLEKTGLIDDNTSVTYRSFRTRVDRLAAALYHTCGLRRGTMTAMLMSNSVDFCAVFFALAKLGCMVSCLNTKKSAAQLRWELADARAEYLFSDAEWARKLEEVVPGSGLRGVCFAGEAGAALSVLVTDVGALTAQEAQDFPAMDDPEAPFLLMYTSGTTGTPKGALMSQKNLLQNALAYIDLLHLVPEECTVIGVPMFHITGLACLMLPFVMLGAQVVLVARFKADVVYARTREFHANHIHAVPAVFSMLLDAQGSEIDPEITMAVCGGGPISDALIRRFCAVNPNAAFYRAYGMTETAGAAVLGLVRPGETDETRTGPIFPNMDVRILDEQLRPLPAGEVGQIALAGAPVMTGYWQKEPGEGFHDGYFLSGDLGLLDEDGCIHVVDRIKDTINRGGEKIFSIIVEHALMELPGVRQAAVFPLPDPVLGEIPAAVLVADPAAQLTAAQVQTLLRTKLAKYEIPACIEFRDALPLNANNKVQKKQLKEELTARLETEPKE